MSDDDRHHRLLARVVQAAAEVSGLDVDDILEARWRPCPAWRRAVWAILADHGWSQAAIARATGHERTTVRDGLRHVDEAMLAEVWHHAAAG